MSARSPSAAVVTNQLLSQLDSEIFQVRQCGIGGKLFVQDEAVRHCHVEEKVENVLVEFSTFCTAGVVAAELVSPVNPSHVLVVGDDGLGTWHLDS